MKKALICLEQLGVGGVETFAITQIEEFARRGIKCYVMARNGILSKRLMNNKNIKYIEFDFELKNEIDFEKIKEAENIIKKNKIDFIYIHQFPCIQYILPCAFKLSIPYVAYLHNGIPGTIDWYIDYYSIYRSLFPIYFSNASKIIAISDKVKKENQELFNLPSNKYIVVKNSLSFDEYPDIEIELPNKYRKLLWFGRVSKEKRNSIIGAINFYNYVKENYNPKAKLTIVGNGDILEELKNKYSNENIVFKGALSNVKPEIEKADIVLGMGRCAIEAMASKKPTLICGYEGNVSLISNKTIDKCMKDNFTGRTLKDNKKEIFEYSTDEMKNIINDNYKYIEEKLSIKNSIYLDIDEFPNKFDFEYFLRDINRNAKDWDRLQELNWLIREENEFITDELGNIVATKAKKMKLPRRIVKVIGRRVKWITQKSPDKKSKRTANYKTKKNQQ